MNVIRKAVSTAVSLTVSVVLMALVAMASVNGPTVLVGDGEGQRTSIITAADSFLEDGAGFDSADTFIRSAYGRAGIILDDTVTGSSYTVEDGQPGDVAVRGDQYGILMQGGAVAFFDPATGAVEMGTLDGADEVRRIDW